MPKTSEFPTLNEIARVIPKHCFRPSLWRSLAHVAIDFGLVFALGAGLYFGLQYLPSYLHPLLCVAYVLAQGTVFMGLFVAGHDCGHESFSRIPWVNNVVGNLTHTFILTPYMSWVMSHRHHHQNTGHIDRDEPFAPQRESRKSWRTSKSSLGWTLKRGLVGLFGTLWFPYLISYSNKLRSHFWPADPMFKSRRTQVVLSLVYYLAALALIGLAIAEFGFWTVLLYYLAPVFVFASWLVIITFCHHNRDDCVWYGDKEWTYVKGNLSSVDYNYGRVLNFLLHDISTHQIHHLFPFIPHYHLKEATQAFRQAFPHLVRVSDRNVIAAYFRHAYTYALYGYVEPGRQSFSYALAKQERGKRSVFGLMGNSFQGSSRENPSRTSESSSPSPSSS